MKTYACYPGTRARFTPVRTTFVTPDQFFNAGKEFKVTSPSANIIRQDGSYEIHLAVPGLSKDKIRIEVVDDQLVVTAITPDENKSNPDQGDPHSKLVRQEYDYSGFKRSFRLHKNANVAALTASYNQGILTIAIPDKEPESIKIDIN